MDFTGKAVLVTGSSTGIGRASVIEFAKRGAAYVGINYLRSQKDPGNFAEETKSLVEAEGSKAVIFEADISTEKTATGLIDDFYKEFGRIDVLVNCAGTTEVLDPTDLDAITPELWNKIMGTNVYGLFYLIRAASKIMKKQGSGSIVCVASLAALGTGGSCIPYNISKGSIVHLVECLVKPLAPEVRINCILPATVSDSNWWTGSEAGLAFRERQKKGADNIPLKREGASADYAKAIVFYASDEAGYCTGSYLPVDGGSRHR